MKKITFILSLFLSLSTFAQMPSSRAGKITSSISSDVAQIAFFVLVILFIISIFLQIRWLYNFRKAGDKLLDAGNELGNKNIYDAGKLVFSSISQILIFTFILLIILGLSFLLVFFL